MPMPRNIPQAARASMNVIPDFQSIKTSFQVSIRGSLHGEPLFYCASDLSNTIGSPRNDHILG